MLLHEELTSVIISHSYDVMNELGIGFLESVYQQSTVFIFTARRFVRSI
jgi:hypothetical protein